MEGTGACVLMDEVGSCLSGGQDMGKQDMGAQTILLEEPQGAKDGGWQPSPGLREGDDMEELPARTCVFLKWPFATPRT